jgi:hypothetical protein
MAARKGDLVLYSGDLLPAYRGTQTPIVSQITFRRSKGVLINTIQLLS